MSVWQSVPPRSKALRAKVSTLPLRGSYPQRHMTSLLFIFFTSAKWKHWTLMTILALQAHSLFKLGVGFQKIGLNLCSFLNVFLNIFFHLFFLSVCFYDIHIFLFVKEKCSTNKLWGVLGALWLTEFWSMGVSSVKFPKLVTTILLSVLWVWLF